MVRKVWYCKDCMVCQIEETGPVACKECSLNMDEAGWIETI